MADHKRGGIDDETRVRRLAEQHGARLSRRGAVWNVRGPTIDILTVDLSWVRADDFATFAATRRGRIEGTQQ